jgi:hypothetical protein
MAYAYPPRASVTSSAATEARWLVGLCANVAEINGAQLGSAGRWGKGAVILVGRSTHVGPVLFDHQPRRKKSVGAQ